MTRDLAQALFEVSRAARDLASTRAAEAADGEQDPHGSAPRFAGPDSRDPDDTAHAASPASRATLRDRGTTIHLRDERERDAPLLRKLEPPPESRSRSSRASVTASAREAERPQAPRGPTIGVVVPTLDEELLLPRLLDRLLDPGALHERDDRADQVVVVDADSRDATRRIARDHGAEVIRAAQSRGVQLATGAHALSSDVLLFLHADCLPRRGALARIRAAFAVPEVDAISMHQDIECDGLLYRWIERCADLRSRLGLVWGDSGLGVRREVYEVLGGFAPLELFEDIDFSLRLRREVRIHWLEDAVLAISARRWRERGALRCTWQNWMLCARFFLGADPGRLAREYRAYGSS
jgi:rSAM/selenodomain-associated transferase 2